MQSIACLTPFPVLFKTARPLERLILPKGFPPPALNRFHSRLAHAPEAESLRGFEKPG